MLTLEIITIAGLIVVVVLFLVWRRKHSSDTLDTFIAKRKPTARTASRADLVQAIERLPVALTLTQTHIYYDNPDFNAELELSRIEEVEYDDETATATPEVASDERVLRFRSHGRSFEFILPRAEADRWATLLPSHRANEPGQVHVV
jgi:hypothetical protein